MFNSKQELTMAKKPTQAKIIRDYLTANPEVKIADAAKTLGLKYQRVYMVKKGMDKNLSELAYEIGKGRNRKADWKTLHISTSDNSIEAVMEKDTDAYTQRMVELAYGACKGQNRVHPVTGKILMQGADPMPVTMHDPVNHPAHYKVGGIETIDFIEAKRLNYNMGNAVKYITRADHKGNRKQDLEKAIWYLNRELAHSL
jgi:hypothetical protein